MSTITKEFTKEQLQQIIETDHIQCGEASSLARIALASLEAEAVAYIIQDAQASGLGRPGFLSFDASISDEDINEYEISVTPLYTAPQLPQPAVQNDAATAIRACLDEFPEDVRDIVEECASIAENACRDAMLQRSEHVTDNTNQQFESLSRGD